MTRYFKFLALSLLLPIQLNAQLHDYTWVLGYGGGDLSPDQDTFGLSILHFEDERLSITDNQEGEVDFLSNNVSYSDDDGQLQFYFNGQGVYGPGHALVPGGAGWFTGGFNSGWHYAQAGIALPFPGQENKAALIDSEAEFISINGVAELVSPKLFFSMIVHEHESEIEVALRKELLLSDTLDFGKLSACRHANGQGIDPEHVNERLQKTYYDDLMAWTDAEQILTFVFEAFDEPWKGSPDPKEPEKHWGLFKIDRSPKLVVQSR